MALFIGYIKKDIGIVKLLFCISDYGYIRLFQTAFSHTCQKGRNKVITREIVSKLKKIFKSNDKSHQLCMYVYIQWSNDTVQNDSIGNV